MFFVKDVDKSGRVVSIALCLCQPQKLIILIKCSPFDKKLPIQLSIPVEKSNIVKGLTVLIDWTSFDEEFEASLKKWASIIITFPSLRS